MAREDYFPRSIAKQRAWFLLYKTNIALKGPDIGMLPADILQEQNYCQLVIDTIDAAEKAKHEAKKKNRENTDTTRAIMTLLRPKIKSHKAHDAYNEGIGEMLGLLGTEAVMDRSTVKTSVKLSKKPNGVSVKFKLKNCEGGSIYSRRGSENDFTFLKYVLHPQFVDERPNLQDAITEQRQYYVNLVLNDQEVGISSDIATITI